MPYSEEEKEIVEYIESGEARSVPNVQEEMQRYTQMAKEYSAKRMSISIRLSESDLYLLKQKALQSGISYQNIIQSLIHQYTHGQIKPEL